MFLSTNWLFLPSKSLIRRFQQLIQETNAHVIHKPIDLMYIFSISGGLPVKQRSAQRQAYRLIEMEPWRRIHGIPIVQHPKYYPANPSLAHRVLLAAIEDSGSDSPAVQEFARLGLEAVWARELDITNEAAIVQLAEEAGLSGDRLLQRAKTEPLLAEQETALMRRPKIGRGPFWGQDRLDMLDDPIVVPSLP
ncbi:thioredoxin-like protein [Aspergillus terricola var. indicus]